MRENRVASKALGYAVTTQMRVFADLAVRWLRADGGDCAGAWTRRGALVIVAIDQKADRIAGELERRGLLELSQRDKPEHIDPVSHMAEGAAPTTPSSPDPTPSEERTASDAWEPTSP